MKQILKFYYFSVLHHSLSLKKLSKITKATSRLFFKVKKFAKSAGVQKLNCFLSFARKNILTDFFVVLMVDETINSFDFIKKMFNHWSPFIQICKYVVFAVYEYLVVTSAVLWWFGAKVH